MRTADITGNITLPEGTEMVMPGDNVTAVFELITPIAMEQGLRFALREGGRTVGAGRLGEGKGGGEGRAGWATLPEYFSRPRLELRRHCFVLFPLTELQFYFS